MHHPRKDQNRRSVHIGIIGLFVLVIILTLVVLICVALISKNWDDEKTKVVKGWQEERQFFLDNTERPIRRLPRAIIIGARKSGTRALLKFLTANPNIRPASKEVHFFDRMHNYRLGLGWYREQMPLSLAGQVTIEKSPAYFITKGVPERIKAMNSSVKLILVVRNPVTRLISDFSQLLAHKTHRELGANRDYDDYYHLVLSDEMPDKGEKFKSNSWLTNVSMEQIWNKAETSFEDYVRRPGGGINEQRRAIRASMYSDYLERWLGQFKRNQLHLVDGERLISDPASELRQVESFLGLVPVITGADFAFNQTKGFFCLTARNLSISEKLDRRKREVRQSAGPVCLGNDKGRRHVKVKKILTNELQQFYSPFNEYLYSLVDRNFNWSHLEIK